jgi:hypothetical protein
MEEKYAYAGFCWGNLRKTFGKPGRRLEDHINIDIQELKCGGVDCFELAKGRDI